MNKTILLVKVETVSGKIDEFFYNGLIETLQTEINNLVGTCDKFGKPTKVRKSFNPELTASLTIVTDVAVEDEVNTASFTI